MKAVQRNMLLIGQMIENVRLQKSSQLARSAQVSVATAAHPNLSVCLILLPLLFFGAFLDYSPTNLLCVNFHPSLLPGDPT